MTTRVGLVGGLGPEATIDYYRRILAAWGQRSPNSAPSMIIDSLDAQHALRLVASDRAQLTEYVLESVERLKAAGADCAVITSNTTHLVFADVAARASIPLISIVETCAEAAERLAFKRCALIGTQFIMGSPLYPTAFAHRGLEIVVPDQPDREWIGERYVTEWLHGDFRDATRTRLVSIIRSLHERQTLDAVILGGTEIPLLFRSATVAGLPALDTTGLHVAAIVERLGVNYDKRT